ncbi:MAG: hypothetical protein AAGE99_01165 [Chlamydiota bacterium]
MNRISVALISAVIPFFPLLISKKLGNKDSNLKVLNKEDGPISSRFDHRLVEQGALALSPEIRSFPFPGLSGEIVFLGKNTRPDMVAYQRKLHIGLKGTEESVKINPGQIAYLAYEDKHLHFSKEVTPLSIQPRLDENGEIRLRMAIRLGNDRGEKLLDEVREFRMEQQRLVKEIDQVVDPGLRTAADALKGGKWWGPDKLFESYGGKEFEKFKGQERIELLSGKGNPILFIAQGATFSWKGGEWIPAVETEGFPMGKVVAISPYKVEWQLWDKEGMESVSLIFNKENMSAIPGRLEDIFTKLRRKASSRVSCRIGNRVTILKEGDWLVRTAKGWHTIKNDYEIKALLNLNFRGDLFIFDRIEKRGGKEFFCGTLFNPMRTEQRCIRLPIARTRNSNRSLPAKNPFSTKIRPSTIDNPLLETPRRNNLDRRN